MKILLTGATSFTGKQLYPLLQREGYEVHCLVRRPSGLENEIIWDFAGELPTLPDCDVIVHLAAYVNFNQDLVPEQYKVNTLSTIQLASFAQKQNSFFIFASMVGVHGVIDQISEETPIAPNNHYALSKYLAEEVVKNFVDDYAILRIGGIYGVDGPQHLGLNNAITEALYKGVNPILKGPGKSKRNYICVLDIAEWILSLVKQSETNPEGVQKILYLAGPETMSIAEYLNQIAEVLLPGQQVEKVDGRNGTDSIVKASDAPFALRGFADYLRSLKA